MVSECISNIIDYILLNRTGENAGCLIFFDRQPTTNKTFNQSIFSYFTKLDKYIDKYCVLDFFLPFR